MVAYAELNPKRPSTRVCNNMETEKNQAFKKVEKDLEFLKGIAERLPQGMTVNDVILDLVLWNFEHNLECASCGDKLSHNGNYQFITHIDPGERNYPHSPDEPASAMFVCDSCHDDDELQFVNRTVAKILQGGASPTVVEQEVELYLEEVKANLMSMIDSQLEDVNQGMVGVPNEE